MDILCKFCFKNRVFLGKMFTKLFAVGNIISSVPSKTSVVLLHTQTQLYIMLSLEIHKNTSSSNVAECFFKHKLRSPHDFTYIFLKDNYL